MCDFAVDHWVVHLVHWVFRWGLGWMALYAHQERPSGDLEMAHSGENL